MDKRVSSRFDLSGRVALVTGATGILGRHFCHALADAGASVAVVDLKQAEVSAFASELQNKHKTSCAGFACNVSDDKNVRQTIAEVIAKLGCIDVVHSNAATKTVDLEKYFATPEDYDIATWREAMAVNLDGMFLVARSAGAEMIKAKTAGSIIMTSSIYGVVAPDQRIYEGSYYLDRQINTPAVYSASKAGVIGLARYLATYWASHGIRVNVLTPGGVESGQNDEFRNRYSARIPLGRMAKADELVGALLYLASDASSYVTGQNIVVDGGLTAW